MPKARAQEEDLNSRVKHQAPMNGCEPKEFRRREVWKAVDGTGDPPWQVKRTVRAKGIG